MASGKPETKIANAIIKKIKERGGDAHKVVGSPNQRRGEPDIEAAWPDLRSPTGWVHAKIEVKVPGKDPSQQQLYRIGKYQDQGYFSCWLDDPDDLDSSLDQFFSEHEVRRVYNKATTLAASTMAG